MQADFRMVKVEPTRDNGALHMEIGTNEQITMHDHLKKNIWFPDRLGHLEQAALVHFFTLIK